MRNLIRPHMSEKSFLLAKTGVYTFDVDTNANKQIVMSAVSEQYKVTAVDARMLVSKGKAKRSYRKRQRPLTGHRSDQKKAYVTLKAGEKIAVFEESE
jgi:large subunit ribosomal protein L23